MTKKISSPTRVDLAGGTLDCWPLYVFSDGAQTTNLAISIFTHVELEALDSKAIRLHIEDLDYQRNFSSLEEVLNCEDASLELVKAHIEYWRPQWGFALTTRSESPVGGGLGGSSSLCISLIKAFAAQMGREMSTLEMVTLAHNIEAKVLKKPTGTQDYVPAIEPGLNIIHYTADGPRVEQVEFPVQYFEDRMLLVYTGQPHHSGLNNWQVIKSVIDGDRATLEALTAIKEVGDAVAEAVRRGRWQDLPGLFRQEFLARVRLSSGFSSPRIEELEKLSLAAGAEAVKICGAGGGGCVLIWMSPERKVAVREACQKSGFKVLDAAPVAQ